MTPAVVVEGQPLAVSRVGYSADPARGRRCIVCCLSRTAFSSASARDIVGAPRAARRQRLAGAPE